MRILLIEDDPMIGAGLEQALRDQAMSVDWVRDGEDGEAALDTGDYAIVLLDLGLPSLPGMEVLRLVRQRGDETPLLIITARDDVESRVAGLDLGADDFLVKPFETSELLARIRAVLRRQGGSAVSTIGNGAITLNLDTHEATHGETSTILPPREFALLHALIERPGRILSRHQLEEKIYGWDEEVESNAIDVLIHYVRKKLGKDVVRNVRGAGWMVASSGASTPGSVAK
ncbi:MAG: response regulator [Alphaproteobacteria bacterium]|nr:response regulator [Alphaproteobacteria bacterium]